MPPDRRPPNLQSLLTLVTSPFVVGSMGRLVSQLLAFLAIFVASNYLSLTQFGLFALTSAVAVIIVTIIYTGLYEALLRSTDLDRDRDTVFWMLAGLGLTGSLVMVGCGVIVSVDTSLGGIFIGMAIIPCLAGPAAWAEALIVRSGGIRTAALCTLAGEFLGFCALLVALEGGYGVYALVASRVVATCSVMLCNFSAVRTFPRFKYDRDAAHQRFNSALPLYGTSATAMFSNYGVDLVLGMVLSPAAVGAYRAGSRIATTASDVVVKPMHSIIWSGFSRLEREDNHDGMRSLWLLQARFLTLVSWPGLTLLALASLPIVELLLAKSWSPAAPVVSVLAFARIGTVLDCLAAPALICSNRAHLLVKLRVASLVLLFVLLAFMAGYGAVAAAWAVLISSAIASGAAIFLVAKILKLKGRQMLATFAPGVLLSAACALVLLVGDVLPIMGMESPTLPTLGAALCVWFISFLMLLRMGTVRLPQP